MAGLFQVLWGQPDGTFKNAATLTGTDGEPLIIPVVDKENWIENICTRPSAVDWDNDGDLDLVVGNYPGGFYLFTGEGQGQFASQPQVITTGDVPLKINGTHSDPFPVDWDGDGDLDLLSGSSLGGVQWAENTAGAGALPDLKPFESLIEPSPAAQTGAPQEETELAGPARTTRVWADDVNVDGKLDILLGDTVSVKNPPASPSAGDSAERDLASDRQGIEPSEYVARPATERTGFVWLYLQK